MELRGDREVYGPIGSLTFAPSPQIPDNTKERSQLENIPFISVSRTDYQIPQPKGLQPPPEAPPPRPPPELELLDLPEEREEKEDTFFFISSEEHSGQTLGSFVPKTIFSNS
jgi:hypothetical protein